MKPEKLSISVFYIAVVLTAGMIGLTSCKKDGQPPAVKPGQAVNPYSTESVFNEVNRTVQQNPNDADALFHLADLYDRNTMYQEAIATYKKVIKLKPDMGYAYFKMGTAYDRINQPSEALNAFKSAA